MCQVVFLVCICEAPRFCSNPATTWRGRNCARPCDVLGEIEKLMQLHGSVNPCAADHTKGNPGLTSGRFPGPPGNPLQLREVWATPRTLLGNHASADHARKELQSGGSALPSRHAAEASQTSLPKPSTCCAEPSKTRLMSVMSIGGVNAGSLHATTPRYGKFSEEERG